MPPLSQEALSELRSASFDDLTIAANTAIVKRDIEALPQIAEVIFDRQTTTPSYKPDQIERFQQLYCAVDFVIAGEIAKQER